MFDTTKDLKEQIDAYKLYCDKLKDTASCFDFSSPRALRKSIIESEDRLFENQEIMVRLSSTDDLTTLKNACAECPDVPITSILLEKYGCLDYPEYYPEGKEGRQEYCGTVDFEIYDEKEREYTPAISIDEMEDFVMENVLNEKRVVFWHNIWMDTDTLIKYAFNKGDGLDPDDLLRKEIVNNTSSLCSHMAYALDTDEIELEDITEEELMDILTMKNESPSFVSFAPDYMCDGKISLEVKIFADKDKLKECLERHEEREL